MRYLIDGHNLIAHLPDIDLQDPDDEAKLVYKLRSFVARTNKRVTVVFDGGLPGGVSTSLSTPRVTALFASAERMTADQILLNHLRKIKNPREYILVTADREIIQAAQSLRVPVMPSGQFALLLGGVKAPRHLPEKDDNPRLSPEEVTEWLKIFAAARKKKRKPKP